MAQYVDKIDFIADKAYSVKSSNQTNEELYEEWKQIFGKIDE